MSKHKPTFDKIVYIFQGGGALGAYQVGVYEGLCKDYQPDWLVGTSIGAINSAIIAGNAPEKRVKKLHEFWNYISTKTPPPPNSLNNLLLERWHNFLSAEYTTIAGQQGFFKLRDWNPWAGIESTADKLSYYDTSELHDTLLKFIDFERLNDPKIRLSIGAVRITKGELVYFDNTKLKITPEHIMASCALPPGFPAILIDDHFYWDAGIYSNTQLNLLLYEREPANLLCFMVQLFDSYGTKPTNMDDVLKRQKDIEYASHHMQSIQVYRMVHNLRKAIHLLGNHLSAEKKQDPEIQKLLEQGRTGAIHVARFHHRGKPSELSSKDYEFSDTSIKEHIKDGFDEVTRALRQPPWLEPAPNDIGLFLYEFTDNPVSVGTPFEESNTFHRIT